MCDNCEHWFHSDCEGVEEELYKILKKKKTMMWFCKACSPNVKTSLREVEKIKDENTKMRGEVKDLKEKNEEVTTKMEHLEDKWKKCESKDECKDDVRAELRKLRRMNELCIVSGYVDAV